MGPVRAASRRRGHSVNCRAAENCFVSEPEDEPTSGPNRSVFVGRVMYANYQTDLLPTDNSFWPFFFKRHSFEHERELRAVILDVPLAPASDEADEMEFIADLTLPSPVGKPVPVDLSTLMERVYVSPGATEWFRELVQSVCANYGLSVVVEPSALTGSPVY